MRYIAFYHRPTDQWLSAVLSTTRRGVKQAEGEARLAEVLPAYSGLKAEDIDVVIAKDDPREGELIAPDPVETEPTEREIYLAGLAEARTEIEAARTVAELRAALLTLVEVLERVPV